MNGGKDGLVYDLDDVYKKIIPVINGEGYTDAVAVVAVPIVRMVINNVQNNACCASMGGEMKGGSCVDKDGATINNYKDNCKEKPDNATTTQKN